MFHIFKLSKEAALASIETVHDSFVIKVLTDPRPKDGLGCSIQVRTQSVVGGLIKVGWLNLACN